MKKIFISAALLTLAGTTFAASHTYMINVKNKNLQSSAIINYVTYDCPEFSQQCKTIQSANNVEVFHTVQIPVTLDHTLATGESVAIQVNNVTYAYPATHQYFNIMGGSPCGANVSTQYPHTAVNLSVDGNYINCTETNR